MSRPALAGDENSIAIDRMTEHDLLEVVEIEEQSNLSPWGWDAYHTELQAGSNSLLLVTRLSPPYAHDKTIAGFIVARHMADEIHVNNVAVRPDFRRRRIGEQLLRAALLWGAEKKATQAVLEVRAGNTAAQELYRACGFEVIGRRRRYYSSPVEDAILMAVSLS
jgi:ribosomal-protein-alanine N-acetyltransferase